jgi:hypothetical protein
MLGVRLLFLKNVAHSITAFEFACTITLTVVPSHVATYVLLAPDSLLTNFTLVGGLHTLNLKAVCFLILVSAFMSLFQG